MTSGGGRAWHTIEREKVDTKGDQSGPRKIGRKRSRKPLGLGQEDTQKKLGFGSKGCRSGKRKKALGFSGHLFSLWMWKRWWWSWWVGLQQCEWDTNLLPWWDGGVVVHGSHYLKAPLLSHGIKTHESNKPSRGKKVGHVTDDRNSSQFVERFLRHMMCENTMIQLFFVWCEQWRYYWELWQCLHPEIIENNFFVDLLFSVTDFHLVAAYLHSVRLILGVSSKLMSWFLECAPRVGAKPKSSSLTNQGTTKLFCSNCCQYRQ